MSLIEYAPTEPSKEALRKLATDKDEYRIRVGDVTRNLGEVLQMLAEQESLPLEGAFSSVPFDLVIESISRLQPRYYSISSSSKESPKTIAVTAVTLQYIPEHGSPRTVYGVNTNYLWRLHEAINGLTPDTGIPEYFLPGPRDSLFSHDTKVARVPVHVRRSQFKLPRNPTVPVIMVGPGTGVAPFRGFVRERVLQKKENKPVGPTIFLATSAVILVTYKQPCFIVRGQTKSSSLDIDRIKVIRLTIAYIYNVTKYKKTRTMTYLQVDTRIFPKLSILLFI
ncbi:Putative NADPH--cytochrome P450 reductase [Rhizopus microsporus]|nr:Putative NADPH--cytochrome P450 reductase [Rhizopus microsporus]